jgi:hypothetical protein
MKGLRCQVLAMGFGKWHVCVYDAQNGVKGS